MSASSYATPRYVFRSSTQRAKYTTLILHCGAVSSVQRSEKSVQGMLVRIVSQCPHIKLVMKPLHLSLIISSVMSMMKRLLVFQRCHSDFCLSFRSSKAFIAFVVAYAVFTDQFLFAVIVPVAPFALHDRIGVPQERVQYWIAVLLGVYGLACLVSFRKCCCHLILCAITFTISPCSSVGMVF